MKLFKEYLTESEKTYCFRLKIADIELTPEVMTNLEDRLKQFGCQSITKTKRLPMQNQMLDFATIGPCEVSILDVVLSYPVNDDQLRLAVTSHTGIPEANILVVPRDHPEEMLRDAERTAKEAGKKEALLGQDYGKETKVNSVYGDEYNKNLVKKLVTRKFEFAKTDGTKVRTTKDDEVNTKSPMGSNKPSYPAPKKAK